MSYFDQGMPLLFPAKDHRGSLALAIQDTAKVAAGVAATADSTIYVNATTGNDANDGLTALTALKTIDAALAKVPRVWSGKNRVILAAGTYAMTTSSLVLQGPVGATAEPFFLIGPAVDSGMGTLTDAGGSTTTVVTGGVGMTVNAYRGARIRYLTGSQAGQTRTVVANSATAFTLNFALGGAPVAGNTFVIEQPGATIQPAGNFNVTVGTMGPRPYRLNVAMYAVKWALAAGAASTLSFNGGSCFAGLDFCEIDHGARVGNQVLFQYGAQGVIGGLSSYFPTLTNSGTFTATYFHNGVANNFASGLVVTLGAALTTTIVVMDTAALDVNELSQVFLYAFYGYKSGIAVDDLAALYWLFGGFIDGAATTGPLVNVRKASLLDWDSSTYTLQNSTSDAVYVDRSIVHNEGVQPTLVGTGNAGYGIRLGQNANMSCAASTVTGVSGDIIVGATTATQAALTAAGFVTDANYLSRISRT